MRRVINIDEVIVYEFLVPKKENLGWESGATDELWYSADFFSGCGCFSWFPWPVCPPPGFFFLCGRCSESEDSVYLNLGIQHSISLCAISCLLFCILSSSQD